MSRVRVPLPAPRNELTLPIGCLKNPLYLGVVALLLVLAGCTGPGKGARSRRAAVDRGVALYIDGDYVEAERHLSRLAVRLESEENRRTVYLYLGRTYMALGDYAQATEAFAAGKRYGGGVRFDEYLAIAGQHVAASPRTIRAESTLTRSELAALIHSFFGERPAMRNLTTGANLSREDGPAHIRWARETGVMSVLPDGGFHPDRKVTRGAFYFVLKRLAARLGTADEVFETLYYPHGVRSAAAAGPLENPRTERSVFIAGSEAFSVLQAMVAASDPTQD